MICANWVRNLHLFIEDLVSLKEYTVHLCFSSCKKEKQETMIFRNVLSNKIEITCGIHKGLYFLLYKNHHESLSASLIFVFRLTVTPTRLIHCSNLCSSCIRPGLFAWLSIAGFRLTFRLFVTFSFTIRAKDLFLTAVFMQRVDDRSTILLRLSRSGRCRTSTC